LVEAEGLLLSMPRVSFADGIAPVAAAQAGEVVVVLWRGDEELRRQVVTLPAGGVHELRL
jgi:hypothetical protein